MHSESRQGTLALAAVCLTSLMFGLEISSIPAILPTLETVLHADFKQLQWVMNAYTIAVTTVLMATGTLADRYGRKARLSDRHCRLCAVVADLWSRPRSLVAHHCAISAGPERRRDADLSGLRAVASVSGRP